MRLRNALTVGVTAATLAPAALTGTAAAAPDSAPAGPASFAHAPAAPPSSAHAPADAQADVHAPAHADAPAAAPASEPAASAALGAIARPAVAPIPVRPGGQQPTCGKVSDPDFPIGSRIHGGPTVHHPGGGFEEWSVELANTTGESCRNIHPVIVFTGRDPGLTPARLILEFYDGDAGAWRPVALETTAEDEVVGAFDDGFPGYVLPAGKSLTVRVRLALADDTPPNQVTVNAAVVQRKGDDGDWVGESDDYRFAVLDDDGAAATVTIHELASTGTGSLLRLGAAVGVVLLGGGVLVLAQRRMRPGRR